MLSCGGGGNWAKAGAPMKAAATTVDAQMDDATKRIAPLPSRPPGAQTPAPTHNTVPRSGGLETQTAPALRGYAGAGIAGWRGEGGGEDGGPGLGEGLGAWGEAGTPLLCRRAWA